MTHKIFSFVAAGEILVDMVAQTPCTPLKDCQRFAKHFGGAPANVAVNMTHLGVSATIVSKVGNDGLGEFLLEFLEHLGIDNRYVARHSTMPTSMVVVTSKQSPPEFIAYRQADTQLLPEEFPDDLLKSCDILHTTAHGIARQPTQNTVLDAFQRAYQYGKWTSFDPNYSSSFWPERAEALKVMQEFIRYSRFCKPSLDDCQRIFGRQSEEDYLDALHEWGAQNIMLTLGKDGAIFSSNDGQRKRYTADATAEVQDTTGAGDAFTAGFFAALLKTHDIDRAMQVGIKTATLNIKHIGAITPLPKLEELERGI